MILLFIFRPTKSNVDNFDHNYDFNAKVIVIGLRVKRSHNFMPRVMRKRLRANFHNFFITSPCSRIVNRRVILAIEFHGQVGRITIVRPKESHTQPVLRDTEPECGDFGCRLLL